MLNSGVILIFLYEFEPHKAQFAGSFPEEIICIVGLVYLTKILGTSPGAVVLCKSVQVSVLKVGLAQCTINHLKSEQFMFSKLLKGLALHCAVVRIY